MGDICCSWLLRFRFCGVWRFLVLFIGVLVFYLLSVVWCSQSLLLMACFCTFALLPVSLVACISVFCRPGPDTPLLGFGIIIVPNRVVCGAQRRATVGSR